MMRRLDINYAWSGDEEMFDKRLRYVKAGDLVVVTGGYNGIRPEDMVDPALYAHIQAIKVKGARVFGYISSRQRRTDGTFDEIGTVGLGSFLDHIRAWANIYGVQHPFIDDWPQNWGSRMVGAVWGMARGYSTPALPVIIINPGAPLEMSVRPPSSCVIVTHEGSNMPARTPMSYEAAIIHHSKDPAQDYDVLQDWGWQHGFVTQDGDDGNPYDGDPGV